MSAESDIRAALVAYAPLIALVPAARISIDAVPDDTQRPYIVFSKQGDTRDLGLDDTLLASTATVDVQVVGSNRVNALAVRVHVEAALRIAAMPSDRGGAGFDPELGAEVEIVTVDWFDV